MSNPTKYSTDFLISVLDSAAIPLERPCGPIVRTAFGAKDGWEVHVSWRYNGKFAVVEHLLAPDGETIDPTDWPNMFEQGGNPDAKRMLEWMPSKNQAILRHEDRMQLEPGFTNSFEVVIGSLRGASEFMERQNWLAKAACLRHAAVELEAVWLERRIARGER